MFFLGGGELFVPRINTFSYLYSELTISVILQKTHASPRRPMNPQILNKKNTRFLGKNGIKS